MPSEPPQRIEEDALGSITITGPTHRGAHLHGINTTRAVDNFALGSSTLGDHADYLDALFEVKLAACRANVDIGALNADVGAAIEAACLQRLDRSLGGEPVSGSHFPVDMLEGSGGTSTNMNVNEVIANLSLLHMGLSLIHI